MITCEHGGNRIPPAYRALFAPHRALLAPIAASTRERWSWRGRLPRHSCAAAGGDGQPTAGRSEPFDRASASAFRAGPGTARRRRQHILKRHYQPYRSQAERLVNEAIAARGRVIHLSCHSFTPELHGKRRTADIGLLYDPARPGEKALCARWKRTLELHAPELAVRRNYPYAGRNDGLTAWLRKRHSPEAYVGIELELNQKHVMRNTHQWAALREAVIESLRAA
jgi:predicted N-formylglutamate amidohydrolase